MYMGIMAENILHLPPAGQNSLLAPEIGSLAHICPPGITGLAPPVYVCQIGVFSAAGSPFASLLLFVGPPPHVRHRRRRRSWGCVRAWHREHAETVALTLIGRQGDLGVLWPGACRRQQGGLRQWPQTSHMAPAGELDVQFHWHIGCLCKNACVNLHVALT